MVVAVPIIAAASRRRRQDRCRRRSYWLRVERYGGTWGECSSGRYSRLKTNRTERLSGIFLVPGYPTTTAVTGSSTRASGALQRVSPGAATPGRPTLDVAHSEPPRANHRLRDTITAAAAAAAAATVSENC